VHSPATADIPRGAELRDPDRWEIPHREFHRCLRAYAGTRIQIERADVGNLNEVRRLWLALHHHHRCVVDSVALVDDDEVSWQRRRALYEARLSSGQGLLLLARTGRSPAGYAFVCLETGPDDTFALDERYAELYSLAVAEGLRCRGIGTALLDAVDTELGALGIVDLKVAVMTGNVDALRLYQRRGLKEAELVLYRLAPSN
jgi:ribosomal protein S18 acetylase RimI-like enzyme